MNSQELRVSGRWPELEIRAEGDRITQKLGQSQGGSHRDACGEGVEGKVRFPMWGVRAKRQRAQRTQMEDSGTECRESRVWVPVSLAWAAGLEQGWPWRFQPAPGQR